MHTKLKIYMENQVKTFSILIVDNRITKKHVAYIIKLSNMATIRLSFKRKNLSGY